LPKPAALRGRTCAFCVVPVLAILAVAALIVDPAGDRGNASSVSEAFLSSQPPTVTSGARGRIQASYGARPLAFERNDGQTDAQVKYMARGNGYTLFLTANDAVFSLHSSSTSGGGSAASRRAAWDTKKRSSGKHRAHNDSTAVVHMQLAGGNSQAKVAASDVLSGTANYFLGNDPSKWRKNVPCYARVSYQDVYPGVDMAFHGAQRQLEFDFLVGPGANPQPIGFDFTGARNVKTDDSGNLVISSTAGDVLVHKPVAYQQQDGTRQAVDARFILKANNRVGFELGNYDRSRELVIDPSVSYAYSTYLGGSAEDDGFGIAFDGSGNAYVTGETESPNFPTVGGVPPNTSAGSTFDVFVTKIAADGSSLIYSTYIAGTGAGKGSDSGNAIAVDSKGDAFVAGGTESTNFPTTAGSFQPKIVSGAIGNAFIFELNPAGSALTYSTYLGGSVSDVALGVAVDSSGDVYAAGKTSSTNFPLSSTPLQAAVAGGFLAKLKPSGAGASDLVFSTYLGGSAQDFASAVALDSSANAYVTGQTSGSLSGTPLNSYGGGISDAFVIAVKADGSAFTYSTYLGGSDIDVGDGIAADSAGNAYVTGETASSNTSTTPFPLLSPLQPIFGGGPFDAFVTKLNPAGAPVYSTYLGGNLSDVGASIAVDGSGNAYVTGETASSNFPPASPTQPTFGGGTSDAFVSEVNAAGSALVFSTYLGGSGDEDTTGNFGAIAVDSAGAAIYVTGNTASSTGFPIMPNPGVFQKTYGGGPFDAFVVKYAQPTFSIAATTPTAVSPGTSGTSTITLTALNGYNSPVKLTCSVTGTGSPLPACSAASFAPPSPVTPIASPGATTTLTITTTGATGSVFHPRKMFYATFLPLIGMAVVGLFGSRRKKVFGYLVLAIALAALLLMPACGGGSSGGGSGSCTTVPSAPTGLASSSTTSTGTTLNWTAATAGANCSVTSYTIYQNGKSIGTASNTTFNVTGLVPSTTYNFTVAASDSAGLSAQSIAVPVTTSPSGSTPAGSYTITITGTGTDASATTKSTQVILTVN